MINIIGKMIKLHLINIEHLNTNTPFKTNLDR